MRRIIISGCSLLCVVVMCGTTEAASQPDASTPVRVCKCVPSTGALSAGFQLAGVGRLGAKYPQLPRIGIDSAIVPPTILKAVAWTESTWQQFTDQNVPLVSSDFGYGLMQITSGMAGASGSIRGSIALSKQARIGGSYLYNIAFGARILARYFKSTPPVNDRDPTVLEDWYYALWAYNGWGRANNPNNPVFTRQGTPATDPSAFPYQERVYYWVEHPPLNAQGNPLWKSMKVDLPKASAVSWEPKRIHTAEQHREIPHLYGATYDTPVGLTAVHAGSSVRVHVTVYNASGIPWAGSPTRHVYGLAYHWVQPGHAGARGYERNLGGVDVLDGTPVPLVKTVRIGGKTSYRVKVIAPSTPGKYDLEWDMWNQKSGVFSQNSVPTGNQSVDVVPDDESVPPYVDPGLPHYLKGPHAFLVSTISSSIPSILSPGQPYSMTLLLFNPGGIAWTSPYVFHRLGSSVTKGFPLKRVAPCWTVPVSLGGKAPTKAGHYAYVWRLEMPSGFAFGPRIRIAFTVS